MMVKIKMIIFEIFTLYIIMKLSNFPPFPGKPPQKKACLKEQSQFWSIMHQIEVPFIYYIQKLVCISKTVKFWNFFSKIGKSKTLSLFPVLLYCLGFIEQSKSAAKSLIFYAIFSSFGKIVMKRRRPGSFPEVFALDCSTSSSFPSRHVIGTTIIAHFTPIECPLIIFMVFSRIILGLHYPTDCFVGFFFGKLCLFCGQYVNDTNLIIFLLLLGVRLWRSAGKILSGILPVVVAPNISISKYCSPLFALIFVFQKLLIDKSIEKKSLDEAMRLLATVSLTLFIVVQLNQLIEISKTQK